eukprot:CAMPEP_0119132494 /NCGR_PEP_ID=MMETSP1310-20130426/11869_1 /TAXON_ID=464262 /ORGANISM="Genus nov. species nov., Strain RCC2339" /LENGTH=260 /DNA_ID=CAMNT_0007123131 /DNA_START=51 /DNA_END=829 /DNA_ORIENTATION=-
MAGRRTQGEFLKAVLLKFVDSVKQIERGDFLLAVPLVAWLVLYVGSAQLSPSIRPDIYVKMLPLGERAMFGTSFVYEYMPYSKIITLVSSLPYLVHFAIPWIYAVYLWRMEGKNVALLFLCTIGTLNLLAVGFQIAVPTAPPWYIINYGYEPATYDVPPNPGRLTDIDDVLGITMFGGLYGGNPVVFGSMPSLHAAWPFTIAVFSRHTLGPWKWVYVLWVWWAAVYLTHHYVIDIIGGVLLSLFALSLTQPNYEAELARP